MSLIVASLFVTVLGGGAVGQLEKPHHLLSSKYTDLTPSASASPQQPQQPQHYFPEQFRPHPQQHSQQFKHHPQQPPQQQLYQQQKQQQRPKRPQLPQPDDKLTSSEERELEELEEEQKPDRLQELLLTSKFSCQGKKDGYYADDGLNCEVFHYCQDGGKHSWLCPNQFAFHQIHLICVPPSSDNICKQSQDYHFVNEYLYKPVNQKEATAYNETLKYADRFFPDGYQSGGAELQPYHNNNNKHYYEDEEEERVQRPRPQQPHPQQQQHHPQQHHPQQPQFRPFPQQQQQQFQYPRQQQRQASKAKPVVYFNPEQINIPLANRRPLPGNHFRPSQVIS